MNKNQENKNQANRNQGNQVNPSKIKVQTTGYKNTEIGVIPVEWKMKSLGDIGEVKMCKRILKSETKKNDLIPFYKIGTFGKDADAFISKELYNNYRQRFSFPIKGEILISASGTIGRLIVYNGKPSYFQDSNIVWIGNNERFITNNFLYYVLQIVNYDSEGSTIQRLYNSIIKSAKFRLPPLPEQTAIATVLSDTDNLLKALQKKIAKKRLIKKGAMQVLLSPYATTQIMNDELSMVNEKNNSQFTTHNSQLLKEGWVVKTLGEICEIRKGQLITSSTKIEGDIPVIAGGKTPAYFHKFSNRKGKTITISGSGANAGYVAFHNYPIFASDCSTISESKSYSIEFIYFFLQEKQDDIYKSQTGGAQPHIHPSDLKPIEIPFISFKEQTRIATILSDMDTEIEQLEKQLAKYKQVKQGLMQNLLTGKIRLI